MSLQHSARLAFLGVTYVYLIKISATLLSVSGVFNSALMVTLIVGMNILAGLVQLLFFFMLRSEFKPTINQVQMIASWLGICGSIAALIPKLLSVAVLVQHPLFFKAIRLQHEIGLAAPLAAALLLFLCCVLFFMSLDAGDLRQASFFFGLLGYSIMVTVYSFLVLNYWMGSSMQPVLAETGISRMALLFSASLSYLFIGIFFIRFGWMRSHSLQG